MLRMYGFDGGTPTHRPYRAITQAAPEVLRIGGERLDLTVLPRWTESRASRPVLAGAWYDLLWTDPAEREARTDEYDRGRTAELLRGRAVALAGHLPMPPVIPVETRLAGAAPVTLDGMQEGHIALLGGPERALEMLRRRQRLAVENDRSTDVYDWDAWARNAGGVINGLPLPKERML